MEGRHMYADGRFILMYDKNYHNIVIIPQLKLIYLKKKVGCLQGSASGGVPCTVTRAVPPIPGGEPPGGRAGVSTPPGCLQTPKRLLPASGNGRNTGKIPTGRKPLRVYSQKTREGK